MCVCVGFHDKTRLKSENKTRGPVRLYRSPGVQNFINKVLAFSHKQSSSMMDNILLIQGSSVQV